MHAYVYFSIHIKEPLEGERGEWKTGLKLNIEKTKIMVSGPVPCIFAQSCLDSLRLHRLWTSSSSVHGILQARILEWVAISSSRGSSQPRDWTWISRIAGRFFFFFFNHLGHQGSLHFMANIRGKSRSSDRFYFLHCRWWLQPSVVFWKESYDKPRQHIKKQRHHFANKIRIVKYLVFPTVVLSRESWTIKVAEHRKNWCFQIVLLEKTLESPLDSKEIYPVNPKGNQP